MQTTLRVAERLHVDPWAFEGPDVDRSFWYALTLVAMNAEFEVQRIREDFKRNTQTRQV